MLVPLFPGRGDNHSPCNFQQRPYHHGIQHSLQASRLTEVLNCSSLPSSALRSIDHCPAYRCDYSPHLSSPAMMPNTFPANISPKRKRMTSEPDSYIPSTLSPSPSVVSVNSLPEVKLREGENLGAHSPRTAVAGRLGELALRGERSSRSELPSSSGAEDAVVTSAPAPCWFGSHSGYDMPRSLPAEGSDTILSGPSESAAKNRPENEIATAFAPPTMEGITSSPRKKRNPQAKPKVRNQRGSPPLADSMDDDPFTWHDSEITGHLLSDPNDDGYGINGVGFKPTAAIAWARSQRRQRQVADWKSREAREARERRRERRDGVETDKMRAIQTGAIQKRVKFDV